MSPRDLPISPSPALGLQTHTTRLSFFWHEFRGSKSTTHACQVHTRLTACLCFLSVAVIKYSYKKQLMGERVLFSLQFWVTFHHFGEVIATGALKQLGTPHQQSRTERNKCIWAYCSGSFLYANIVLGLKTRDWCCLFPGWVFTHQWRQSRQSPIDMATGQTNLDDPPLNSFGVKVTIEVTTLDHLSRSLFMLKYIKVYIDNHN